MHIQSMNDDKCNGRGKIKEGTFQCFNQDDVFAPLAFGARKNIRRIRFQTLASGVSGLV